MQEIKLKEHTRAELEVQMVKNAEFGFLPVGDVVKNKNGLFEIKMIKHEV
ncbi:hypothetical protein [Algibacter lectus]|uniref:Uncharacterized protein n=1 Tax=Algibacter lectus TaxID=221126 RepID=A0A4R8M918_9FLAO|nr:hypothetical protein [Algibacter lectus]MWW24037.1 hypothetical protein [Algibacter lectus]TDY62053.1 hypothetical protein DFQ06_1867 [Algibacter lectus]